jgi:hypothetical protein
MSDLVAFLRARLDEDEAVARAAVGRGVWDVCTGEWVTADVASRELVFAIVADGARTQAADLSMAWDADERRAHIVRHDPARVLAEAAAKRAILDALDLYEYEPEAAGLRLAARCLAAVYAGHPDYREDWKP